MTIHVTWEGVFAWVGIGFLAVAASIAALGLLKVFLFIRGMRGK